MNSTKAIAVLALFLVCLSGTQAAEHQEAGTQSPAGRIHETWQG